MNSRCSERTCCTTSTPTTSGCNNNNNPVQASGTLCTTPLCPRRQPQLSLSQTRRHGCVARLTPSALKCFRAASHLLAPQLRCCQTPMTTRTRGSAFSCGIRRTPLRTARPCPPNKGKSHMLNLTSPRTSHRPRHLACTVACNHNTRREGKKRRRRHTSCRESRRASKRSRLRPQHARIHLAGSSRHPRRTIRSLTLRWMGRRRGRCRNS